MDKHLKKYDDEARDNMRDLVLSLVRNNYDTYYFHEIFSDEDRREIALACAPDSKVENDIRDAFDKDTCIMMTWHIEDITNIRPDLTEKQALEVLLYAEDNHDANNGYNWDFFSWCAEELYPEPECEDDDDD